MFYRALTSHIHTRVQIGMLNNRATQSYLNYNNQLITPRKVGIASNYCTSTHPHIHTPGDSRLSLSLLRRSAFDYSMPANLGTAHRLPRRDDMRPSKPRRHYKAPKLHKHINLNSKVSSWPDNLFVLFPLPAPSELPGSVSGPRNHSRLPAPFLPMQ